MSDYISTTNACKLCKPLGACLAFRGIEGAVPMVHGSQGCATYMRRYIISHFREPMDIASSALGEKHAVYGGGPNLKQGIRNVMTKFGAKVVGIATSCLTETIGDNVPMIVKEFCREFEEQGENRDCPSLVCVSTPSYSGTHMEGFHAAVKAVVDQLTTNETPRDLINLLPGFLSPIDLRYLKEILDDFGCPSVVLPDFSETLDGPALEEHEKIPCGGTPVEDIRAMGGAKATIEFGRTLGTMGRQEERKGAWPPCTPGLSSGEGEASPEDTEAVRAAHGVGAWGLKTPTAHHPAHHALEHQLTAGRLLQKRFGVPLHALGMPIGLREADAFFEAVERITGRERPAKYVLERGRLIDAYVDAHKYLFGKRAVIYGEEDLVVGLTAFLSEVGVRPVLCASGGKSGRFHDAIVEVTGDILDETPMVEEGADFYRIETLAEALSPDLLIGHSKGYAIARKLGIPLIRVGFPIHDRFGGQRVLHVGYRGTQELLDRVVNAVLEAHQEHSPVGYGYM